jgi:hypothetical protein
VRKHQKAGAAEEQFTVDIEDRSVKRYAPLLPTSIDA